MYLIDKPITLKKLTEIANERFIDMTKAVVDIDKNIMVLDADLHADQEAFLLKNGSKQISLWGINLYPELYGTTDFVEFDSMINLRPSQNNRTRGVENLDIQNQILSLVEKLIINE